MSHLMTCGVVSIARGQTWLFQPLPVSTVPNTRRSLSNSNYRWFEENDVNHLVVLIGPTYSLVVCRHLCRQCGSRPYLLLCKLNYKLVHAKCGCPIPSISGIDFQFATTRAFILPLFLGEPNSLWGRCGRHNSPPASSFIAFVLCYPHSAHVSVETVHPSLLRSSSSSFPRWYHLQSLSSDIVLVSSIHVPNALNTYVTCVPEPSGS